MPPLTEVEGRALAWAESEIQRLAYEAEHSVMSDADRVASVRSALASSFRIGYAAGRIDEEKAARTRPRK
jgi:hypothetical protein